VEEAEKKRKREGKPLSVLLSDRQGGPRPRVSRKRSRRKKNQSQEVGRNARSGKKKEFVNRVGGKSTEIRKCGTEKKETRKRSRGAHGLEKVDLVCPTWNRPGKNWGARRAEKREAGY